MNHIVILCHIKETRAMQTPTPAHIIDMLADAPVVAAVKDDAGLEQSLACGARVVFVLYGTVVSIPGIVARIAQAGKAPMVHIDLIDGLAARDVAVDYIAQNTQAAGILSTKPAPLRRARELGLVAIRRFFLLDSMALANLQKQLDGAADLVEVLPGAMPKVLCTIAATCPMPLIAGGLIADKEDVVNALAAGALAISSTNPAVWNL